MGVDMRGFDYVLGNVIAGHKFMPLRLARFALPFLAL